MVLVIRLLGERGQRREWQRLEDRYHELGEGRVRDGRLVDGPIEQVVDVDVAAQRFQCERPCGARMKRILTPPTAA